MKYELKIYEMASGKRPFDEWINNLADKKAQIAIDLRLGRIKMGNFGNCEPVGNMVFELKFKLGPGYRVYFAKCGLSIILLLCGGDKKTQAKDIVKAKRYLQDFKNAGAQL